MGAAYFAAKDAANTQGGGPVVLAVITDMLKESRLEPDEDSQGRDWCESIRVMGTLSYRGTIPPEAISLAYVHRDRKWVEP